MALFDIQQAQALDPGGAISGGFDAAKMDENLRAVFASEGSSQYPEIPDGVKLDIAMQAGNSGDVSRFVGSVNKALDLKWNELGAAQADQLQQVVGDPSELGFQARGGIDPNQNRYNLDTQSLMSGPQGMRGEFTRSMSGVLGGAIPVKAADSFISSFIPGGILGSEDSTRFSDVSPQSFDPKAVATFQRQAVQFGVLPKTTKIDGQWRPEYNSMLFEIGNTDFERAMHGNRAGAIDPFSPNKLDLMNELLSPQFALMFTQELAGSMMYDHWWTGERVDNIANEWQTEYNNFKKADGLWEKFTAATGMLIAPMDDIIMPAVNIALLGIGVGEVVLAAKLTGRGALSAAKAIDTTIDAVGVTRKANRFSRSAIDAASTASAAQGRAKIFDMPGSRLIRGFDHTGRLKELQKFTRKPGRLMSSWDSKEGAVGTAAYRGLDAWRQQRSAFMVKKSTQQLMRYSQARMATGAMGDESAVAARDRARDRYWKWSNANPHLALMVGLGEGVVMPQNIYPVGFFKSQAQWSKNASNVLRWTNLPDAMASAMLTQAEAAGDTLRVQSIRESLDRGNPGQTLIDMFGGEEPAMQRLYSAIIHTGVEVRINEQIASTGKAFKSSESELAFRFRLRNKYLAQVRRWNHTDTSDATRFIENLYGSESEEYARYGGMLNNPDIINDPYYAELQHNMKQMNTLRDSELAYYIDMVAKDPNLLSTFLGKNPTYFEEGAWERLISSSEMASDWIKAIPGDEAAVLNIATDVAKVTEARHTRQTMPSVMKVLDPVTGNQTLRQRAGLSNVATEIKGWLTGERQYGLTNSYNLNANPLSQLDAIDSPNAGRFTPASTDTVTKQDALAFFDTLDLLVERRRAVEELVTAAGASGIDIGKEISQNLTRNGRTVKLSSLDEMEYKAFIDVLVNGEPASKKKVQTYIGGRPRTRTRTIPGRKTRLKGLTRQQVRNLKSERVRRLIQHMEVAGDLKLDPRTILRELDDTMHKMALDPGVWDDTFGLSVNEMRRPASRSVSQHLESLADSGRARAKWMASEVDVKTFDPYLAEHLERNGHKLVYGQEFWEPLEIVDALQLPVNLNNDIGVEVAKQLPFLSDAMAESALIQKMARPVTQMAAWAMYPGEKMFIPVFTRRLQQETSRALMESYRRNPEGYAQFGVTSIDDLDPNGRLVNTVIKSQQARLAEVQRKAQHAQESTLGFVSRTASRISHSVVPRTLVDPAVRNLRGAAMQFQDPRFVKNGKYLAFDHVFDDKTLKGLEMALKKAQDLSDMGANAAQAKKVRGPTLQARDWIETNGLARGAVSGAFLTIFGGTTARAGLEQQARLGGAMAYAKGAAGRGLVGVGGSAAMGAISNYQETGDPFASVDLQQIALGGAGAAVGGMAGFAGAAMGSQDGLATGLLGAAGGAAISKKGLSLPSKIGRATGALDEGKDISRVGVGMSAQAGSVAAGLLGTEGDTEQSSVMQRMGAAAAGAALGPTVSRLAGTNIAKMHIYNSTLTERMLNLSMALRFTLSPLFDMQRHVELATMAITKSPENFAIPVKPLGRRAFQKKQGVEVWNEWADRYDNAATAVHGKNRANFAAAEETARQFRDEGILGFNPTDKSISIMQSLVDQGMDDVEAYKAARSVVSYGVEGRKTGELFVNSIFFPFSFQSRFIGRGIKWMADDAARAMYVTDALVAYQLLDETYDLSSKLNDYLPLAKSLQKLNGMALGVSMGEFGGIDRPFINFFVPVMAQAYKTAEGTLMLGSPSDALGQAQETEPIEVSKLMNRLVPLWRDIDYLIQDGKDQWQVLFSPTHMTSDNQRRAAMQQWSAQQANADVIARGNGFAGYTEFIGSNAPGADKLRNTMNRTKHKMEREFPLWAEGRDQSVVRWTANKRVLQRRAAEPKIPVDREIARMVNYIQRLEQEFPASETGIDWQDIDTIPVSKQNEIREFAIQLSQQGHGFEEIWDKYFRQTFGPIRRPVYQSVSASDRSVLKSKVGT